MATFSSGNGDEITVSPAWKTKARDAVKNLLQSRKLPSTGGDLTITSNIPVGYGLGSSTADVIASIRAAASYHGISLAPMDIARMAVEAEQACDSTMFDGEAVLFAQREGLVIEGLHGELPAIDLVSVNVAPDKPVDTLAFPPARYSTGEIEQFRSLRGFLRTAIRSGNASLLGRVATASATINQRHLPQEHFADIKLIAEKNNAVGIQVAHSGTVIGVMFDAAGSAASKAIASAMTDLSSAGFSPQLYRH
ncbi:GHMP family kinase ATP-binding protein [Rhizobium leguminosarum]|uniref:GHMP family kinase ATP-binding protein n=1 Tax=Rhizobium leguminosarum TaxID=384 RepID=UPI003F955D0F